MFLCPYCDAALTRCATLALALRKAAAWAHSHGQHSTAIFADCPEEPCVSLVRALVMEGLPVRRIKDG